MLYDLPMLLRGTLLAQFSLWSKEGEFRDPSVADSHHGRKLSGSHRLRYAVQMVACTVLVCRRLAESCGYHAYKEWQMILSIDDPTRCEAVTRTAGQRASVALECDPLNGTRLPN
jgi:hypothetical protein